MAGTYRKHHKKKRKKQSLRVLLLTAVVVWLLGVGGLSAKYVYQQSQLNKVTAGEFYFTSDLLSTGGKEYTLSADTTSINITLRNYEDELRWADSDISYTYTVKKGDTDVKSGRGTLSHKSTEKSEDTIPLSDLTAGTYTVTAQAYSPFKETLKGTFVIPAEDKNISYSVSDSSGSAYALLTISTKGYSGKASISWPEDLIPDSTQEALKNVKSYDNNTYTAGNVSVKLEKFSSYTYRFFKSDISHTYTKDNITVTGEGS